MSDADLPILGGLLTGARVERRLAAILAADVAGFSALMERDEEGTYSRIGSLRREVIEPRLSEHQGRLIKTTGDGFLAEFASPIAALRCALAIQSTQLDDPDALRLRIGLNLGDVIIEEGGDVYGEGVNVAARLEGLADPGGILISGKIHSEVEGKVTANFEDRGEQQIKNITRPVRIYAVRLAGAVRKSAATIPAINITKPLQLPDKPSIAVLPFQNMSGDPEQEYFADGIVEDIITELSHFKGLLVIARNSTFTYKGKPVDVKKVGKELGVRYVLEGSVRRAGQRVRITAQLIDTETGGHVWAEKYDADLTDIFELQDQITKSVVATLQTEFLFLEGSLVDRSASPSIELWSMGKRVWKELYQLNRESLATGLELARRMIRDYPDSPEGYKMVSLTAAHQVYMGFASDPNAMKSEAEKSARMALSLATNDEHIYWALAITLGVLQNRFDEAEAAMRRSIEINPNFSLGYGTYGTVLAYAGRARESIAQTEYAIRLNPKDPSIFFRYSVLSIACFTLEDYEQSLKWAKQAAENKPTYWVPHAIMAASQSILGRPEQATKSAQALLQVFPTISFSSLPIEPIRPEIAKKAFYEALAKAGVPS
jgi:adenylate cyclase